MIKNIDNHNKSSMIKNIKGLKKYKKDIDGMDLPVDFKYYIEKTNEIGFNIISKLEYILGIYADRLKVFSYRQMISDLTETEKELLEITSSDIDFQEYYDSLKEEDEDFDEDYEDFLTNELTERCRFLADNYEGYALLIEGKNKFTKEEKLEITNIYENEKAKVDEQLFDDFQSIYFYKNKIVIEFPLIDMYALEEMLVKITKAVVKIINN